MLPDFPPWPSFHCITWSRIIGFRKGPPDRLPCTDDSVVILSLLSTRQSRLTLEEALTQALELLPAS